MLARFVLTVTLGAPSERSEREMGATLSAAEPSERKARLGRMRIGAHIDSADPLAAAAERGANVIQFFLSDPQGWEEPQPRDDTAALIASDVDIYVHSPYRINVATRNHRI